jgi:hypothetical protein
MLVEVFLEIAEEEKNPNEYAIYNETCLNQTSLDQLLTSGYRQVFWLIQVKLM